MCVNCGEKIESVKDARLWVHAETGKMKCSPGFPYTVASPEIDEVTDDLSV